MCQLSALAISSLENAQLPRTLTSVFAGTLALAMDGGFVVRRTTTLRWRARAWVKLSPASLGARYWRRELASVYASIRDAVTTLGEMKLSLGESTLTPGGMKSSLRESKLTLGGMESSL